MSKELAAAPDVHSAVGRFTGGQSTPFCGHGDTGPTQAGAASTPGRSPRLQTSSAGNVPIQGPGGDPNSIVELLSPAGAGALSYAMVKPVTQLGSSELAANQLARNADGSLTMWFGPTLPVDAPASNWIPTPSTGYYVTLYPNTQVSTEFQLT